MHASSRCLILRDEHIFKHSATSTREYLMRILKEANADNTHLHKSTAEALNLNLGIACFLSSSYYDHTVLLSHLTLHSTLQSLIPSVFLDHGPRSRSFKPDCDVETVRIRQRRCMHECLFSFRRWQGTLCIALALLSCLLISLPVVNCSVPSPHHSQLSAVLSNAFCFDSMELTS